MFDGESTATVDWSGPGIVVDLSAVLQSPAFSSILVCAGAWLAQVVARKDRQRIIVVDECWKAIRDAGFVAWGEETQKLSRGYGVQFVTIVQRISDLASQADDGTATAKRAQGFVTEAETKVTFNLSGGEARASRDVMDWTESETQLVPRLPRGRALWRVGEHGAIVQTILSPRDMAMCDSNQAMRRDSNQALGGHSVTVGKAPRLTWSRLGIALSIGLVVFGCGRCLSPPSHPSQSTSVSGLGPQARPNAHVANCTVEVGNGHAVAISAVEITGGRSGPIGGGAIRRGHGHHRSDPPRGRRSRASPTGAWSGCAPPAGVAGGLGGGGPQNDGGARPTRSRRRGGCRPGGRGRHRSDGRDHHRRAVHGGAGGRAGHAASDHAASDHATASEQEVPRTGWSPMSGPARDRQVAVSR